MAFFSGQDIMTLQSEGNDTNCFVSLIVDTRGTYQAAITRKVQYKTEITTKNLGSSYEFFGEGTVSDNVQNEDSKNVTSTIIEYFMLDVQREETENPLDYLDARFEELERKKSPTNSVITNSTAKTTNTNETNMFVSPKWNKDGSLNNFNNAVIENMTFRDWLKGSKVKEPEQQSLFTKEEMEEIDAFDWQPDPTIIHHLACQLATCSLIINKDIDLKQWIVRHMQKKYNELFLSADSIEFDTWADTYVDFIISHYNNDQVPGDDCDYWDFYLSRIAAALVDELGEYPENPYLAKYIDLLSCRMYE